jgi:saccharopine dehydrogenase-like NADP-dependent oxidoreductase
MKPNVLIVGAGAVAHVAAHKAAQNNDVLGDICIARRTKEKAEEIIESIRRKDNIKDQAARIYARQVDALDIPAMANLIEETASTIVVNLGTSFINMSVLEACIQVKTVNGQSVTYMDTAIHEDPTKVAEDPSWYANYEWKKKPGGGEGRHQCGSRSRIRPGRRERVGRARRQALFRQDRYNRYYGC